MGFWLFILNFFFAHFKIFRWCKRKNTRFSFFGIP